MFAQNKAEMRFATCIFFLLKIETVNMLLWEKEKYELLFALHFQWPYLNRDLLYIITSWPGQTPDYHVAAKLINLRSQVQSSDVKVL